MAVIQDYQSLTQAIADFSHRADLSNNLYTDYFIQLAQNKLATDIIKENFGNGIQAMEVALPLTAIAGGTVQVPLDWFAPKTLQIADNAGDIFTLVFKSAAWIYDRYPVRQPRGMPSFIARDVFAPCIFQGQLSGSVLTVNAITSGALQVGSPVDDITGLIPFGTVITALPAVLGGSYTVNTFSLVPAEAMVAGGNVFIFGPYPDSAYTVQGTYYSKGTPLSIANPTNWMVLQTPEALHAACMLEAGKFLKDGVLIQMWGPIYQEFLEAIINKDKGERFSSSTMQIELG